MNSTYYFQELTILADGEISPNFILGKAFGQIHLALVERCDDAGRSSIGVAFPQYRFVDPKLHADATERQKGPPQIGQKVRLFAREKSALQDINISKWLGGLDDYVHVTSVKLLARKVQRFMTYSRYQPRASKPRLIRRRMKRQSTSLEAATTHFDGMDEELCRLPYVSMRSLSSQRQFRLFVRAKEFESESDQSWSFSSYGLSEATPVPAF